MGRTPTKFFQPWRFKVLIIALIVIFGALILRMLYLTVIDRPFLLKQSNSRVLRTISIPAYRGMILDSEGDPLAVSTPVDSVWINPQDFTATTEEIFQLCSVLKISPADLSNLLKQNAKKQFMYVKRGVDPSISKQVQALALPGVYLQHSYNRYYPQGASTAHILGFTNIDNQGQEGLELQYNKTLQGIPGEEKVLKDRLGHVVAVLGVEKAAKPGKNLSLTINNNIQYLAYQVLQETVAKYHAESGSVVVLNPKNGDILAMTNVPSYDPNHRADTSGRYRNRAVTDMFEPGSTMKTFTIASVLDKGQFTPNTIIDTGDGVYHIDGHDILDDTRNGKITVTKVLQVSSNIGAAKMALSQPPENLVNMFRAVGFGKKPATNFPGESAGVLPQHQRWNQFELATLAFGYGITVTPLQLAHAYTIIANGGIDCPVSLVKRDQPPKCHRAISASIASQMTGMLQAVLQPGGTGVYARVHNYHVAGKTGTAYIADAGGYDHKAYMSSFVGFAPATDPQVVVAIVIRKPQDQHFGAVVAAPAFQKIMSGVLEMLNIAPDDVSL